jgi:hypothetical protein
MAARRGVVIDRFGNVVEDADGVLRDGQRLVVPVELMDSSQRAVKRNTEQRLHALDAWLDLRARTGAGMRRHRVPTPEPTDMADGEQFDHARAAYLGMKRRLSDAWKTKRALKPVGVRP